MSEKQLITKTYYQSLINNDDTRHPIQQLGELFAEEQKKEIPDASEIRFAQGEVYYHNKDYEAAIYKWGNVHNDLEQWAKKNIADAYLELAIYPDAEKIYQSIQTDSLTLRTEVLLQLFSLYIQQEKYQNADQTIKKIVSLNPDYPNVTKLARTFYENHKDWQSALELAIGEGIRTEDLTWFELLKSYIKNGYAGQQAPHFFFGALSAMKKLDEELFEQCITALWDNYETEQGFFKWLSEFNGFLKELDFADSQHEYRSLSKYYKQAYDELMSGNYLMKQLDSLIPDLLHAWLKIVAKEELVLPSSAIFAWNEIAPNQISAEAVKLAEKILFQAVMNVDILQMSQNLYHTLQKWTENRHLEQNVRLQMLSEQLLDFDHQITGVVSFSNEIKTEFLNHFMQEELVSENNRQGSVSIYRNGHSLHITQYRDYQANELTLDEYLTASDRHKLATTCYDVILPNNMLSKYRLNIVDLPDLNRVPVLTDALMETLQILDTLLIPVDAEYGLSDPEQKWVEMIQKQFPRINMYFVQIGNQTDEEQMPSEQILYDYSLNQRQNLADQLMSDWNKTNIFPQRMKKYLEMLSRIMDNLLEQRMKIEKQLQETIQRKEDLGRRVNGAINQLEDLTVEKINMIQKSFQLAKEETRKEIINDIPNILKETASTITRKRDFQRIHIELNDEMNTRIEKYLHEKCMPKFLSRMQDWLALSETELKDGKKYLDEIAVGFNSLIGQERLQLDCDFKVLEDWERDIERLTSKVNYEPVNILLRYTPRQVLLKSAGKVLGKFIQSKEMLVNGFKQLIETGNYQQLVEDIADRFFNPFYLLEQGIDRDIQIFFKNAYEQLSELAEDTVREINEKALELTDIKENPEAFHDPLKIFEITRLQYKYILEMDEVAYSQVHY